MLRRSLTAVRVASKALPMPAAMSLPSVVAVPKRFGGHGHHDSPAFEKLYKQMAIKAAVDPIQEGQRPDDAYTPGDNLDRMSGPQSLLFGLRLTGSTLLAFAATFGATLLYTVIEGEQAELPTALKGAEKLPASPIA